MSQENVELVYRILNAFNRRDLGTFLGLIDPEVEFTTRVVQVEGDPYYHGHDGIREWWQDLLATFPDLSIAGTATPPSRKGFGRQTGGVTASWSGGMTFDGEAGALEAAGLSE